MTRPSGQTSRVHYCLAVPGPAGRTAGDMLDCSACRVALLEAFRAPADVPELRSPVVPAQAPEASVQPRPATHGHTPEFRVGGGQYSGTWEARCSCGWRVHGFWGHGQHTLPNWVTNRPTAEMTAERACAGHMQVVAQAPVPAPEHVVVTDVTPLPDGLSGTWTTACACGWEISGSWGEPYGVTQYTARRLALTWAQRHLDNPIKEQ